MKAAPPPPAYPASLQGVRKELYDELNRLYPEKDWSFVQRQIGMFS